MGSPVANNEKDDEKDDIRNMLQYMFPNYQQHYWNDRSTWNPLEQKSSINDTFDLSFHSLDLQFGLGRDFNNSHENPFPLEEVSIIVDPSKQGILTESEEAKQESLIN